MKILQIGKFYPPKNGGIETVSKNLAEGFAIANIQCDVICFNDTRFTKEEVINDNIRIIRVSILGVFFSMPVSISLYKILKRNIRMYDILHVHLPNPFVVFCLVLLNPKQKIVVHWHSDIIKQKFLKFVYLPFERIFLRRSDKIVGTTQEYVKHSKQLRRHIDKVEVVPLGIRESDYKPDDNLGYRLKNMFKDDILTLTVGRLISYKGLNYLIEAFALLPKEYKLIIVGDGPEKNRLLRVISSMFLTDRIMIISNLSFTELSTYYSLTDVFCLPSITKAEAFGVVQLEAMVFGKPIVSTNILGSGVDSVNINNITGKIVPVRNSSRIADAIINITKDKNVYKQYCTSSRSRFEQNYTSALMVSRFIDIYTK